MTLPVCDEIGLPLGRWPATPEALEVFASMPDQTHRAKILDDWRTLTDAVRDATGALPACWLSGSFFTTKELPSDLDCVYIVPHEALTAAGQDPDKAKFLQAISGHGARVNFGLQVDAYFLSWWPREGTHRGSAERRENYLETRGYWDDLWSRSRHGELSDSKYPRRGYLEVVIDGYT